jgi:hypothetical protein
VLPDGTEHASGAITLCQDLDFTPASALHVSYVDGMPIGMLLGNRSVAEAAGDDRPFMLFARDSGGLLHLRGYGVPGRGGFETYELGLPGGERRVTTQQLFALADHRVLVPAVTH